MDLSFGVGMGGMDVSFGVGMGGMDVSFEVEMAFEVWMGEISGRKVSFGGNGTEICWVLTTPVIVDCSISFKPGSTSKVKMMK